MDNEELNEKYVAALNKVKEKYEVWLKKAEQNDAAQTLEAFKVRESAEKQYNEVLLEVHKEWLKSNHPSH